MRGFCARPFRALNLQARVAGLLLSCLAVVVLPSCVDRAASDPYDTPIAGSTSRYLQLALDAEKFIDSLRVETEHGSTWLRIPNRPDEQTASSAAEGSLSFYHGIPGIVLFYLELAETTGDEGFLARAREGANEILHRMVSAELDPTLYGGLAGLGFVLEETFRATGDQRYRAAAAKVVDLLIATASEIGAGVGWIEPIPFAESFQLQGTTEVWDVAGGSAGVGLALLQIQERGVHDQALDLATRIGERLVEVAEITELSSGAPGYSWQMMATDPGWTAPNFSHGTAGIAYFLARLHQATGDRRYLERALGGARYLQSIADIEESTDNSVNHLIYHHENDGEDLYYLSWCHGPAGTGRLFYLLSQITGDKDWTTWLVGGAEGILGTGAPERRSEGFWNNISVCCGDAGVGEYALDLYSVTSDSRWLELAERVATQLEAKSQAGAAAGICWRQAEHRVRPDFLEAQTGYMQGAAGVGSYFLHLHTSLQGARKKIVLPDSPFVDS